MIVSRKNGNIWKNLEGYESRLSGPYYGSSYLVNNAWHRLYGRSFKETWDLNYKSFKKFKELE